MNALLKLISIAGLLGAGVALANPPLPKGGSPVDDAWTSRGFAARLRSAAESAGAQLREAPEVAGAEVLVRSIEDHAPLRVEAAIEWVSTAEPVSAERRAALLSSVRSWFEPFARVEVVLPATRERAR